MRPGLSLGLLARYGVFLTVTGIASSFYVWTRLEVRSETVELGASLRELGEVEIGHDRLELELAALRDPERVGAAARLAGFSEELPVDEVVLP